MTAWRIIRSARESSWCGSEPTQANDGEFVHLILDADNPVNALSESVLKEFRSQLASVAEQKGVQALFLWSAKEDHFVAGADIDQIAEIRYPETGIAKAAEGQEIFQALADLPFPTFAVIRGTCLGGGLEMVLAADYRIAVDDPTTRIGLPEVNLGIIPGFGGTQRLPRLIGIQKALPLILAGKRLPAKTAYRRGVVDSLVPSEGYHEMALRAARKILDDQGRGVKTRRRKLQGRFWSWLLEKNPIGRSIVSKQALKRVLRVSGGHYPAPPAAVKAVIEGYGKSLVDGLKLESQLCGELIATDICKNLISIFQDSERSRHLDVSADSGGDTGPALVGVLGAGVMGAGIANLLLQRGQEVRLRDINAEALGRGLKQIGDLVHKKVKTRRLTPTQRDELLSRLTHTVEPEGFGRASIIVEAIIEKLEVKRAALRELEPGLADDTVFATNTSALAVTEIQEGAARPERVVGMHFFNPVHRMPLVEVIPGEQTAPWAVARTVALAQKLGKYPVVVKDRPGFLVNRLLAPYLNSACRLLERGVPGPEIDAAAERFGLPMGPFRLLDEVGLDIAAEVSRTLHEAFGDRAAAAPLLDKMIEAGTLGRKTGTGFYRYLTDPRPHQVWNEEVQGLVETGEPKSANPSQITTYLLDRILDEAARCLEEEVVARPSDVDLAMVMGTGFPPFRGGPLRFADEDGLGSVVERLKERAESGEGVVPCDLLLTLARDAKRFYSLEPSPDAAEQLAAH